jgi:hypothetical protein
MCTFCGRYHNNVLVDKIVRIYGKNDKYLGIMAVKSHLSVRDYQKNLHVKYPDWEYTMQE